MRKKVPSIECTRLETYNIFKHKSHKSHDQQHTQMYHAYKQIKITYNCHMLATSMLIIHNPTLFTEARAWELMIADCSHGLYKT